MWIFSHEILLISLDMWYAQFLAKTTMQNIENWLKKILSLIYSCYLLAHKKQQLYVYYKPVVSELSINLPNFYFRFEKIDVIISLY